MAKRKVIHGTNRRWALLGTMPPSNEVIMRERESMSETQIKSMFNKEKWLPLVYVPFRISHYCCGVMKKKPLASYHKDTGQTPIIGTMAIESRVRKQAWLRTGCNAFDGKKTHSTPMAFWTEQDVLEYICKYGLEIASVYGEIVQEPLNDDFHTTGVDRTGCVFCGFGMHREKGETRFQKLKKTHPKQWDFAVRGGQWIDNTDYVPNAPEYDGIWKNWNPEKIWVPGNGGLGFGKVFEMVNEIYGSDFYRWE